MEACRGRYKSADCTLPFHLLHFHIKSNTKKQEQTLKNIAAVLEAAGSDFNKIVKLNVYLKNYADFVPMNEVYITHFGAVKPVSLRHRSERLTLAKHLYRRALALRFWT